MKTDAKVTIPQLKAAKAERKLIAMVTAYDATFGRLVDEAGVDMVLVGDSLGMVMQGGANTLAVTLDEMIYHTRCVARSLWRAFGARRGDAGCLALISLIAAGVARLTDRRARR